MDFTIQHSDSQCSARSAELTLGHGTVRTPVFMPVGTEASVKSLRPEDLRSMNTQIILANSYHLYLRPGIDVIRRCAGLHSFMNWRGNILTDSGGFQIFSLARLQKVQEEGVEFRSHIDGSLHRLRPEDAVLNQDALGSDIQMVLDVCTKHGAGYAEARKAVDISATWAERAMKAWQGIEPAPAGELFGIVQGNFFHDLRKESAERTGQLNFPGYAIGGLSVGEPFAEFQKYLASTSALLPKEKPRYLMGVGTPAYILEAIEQGIDMFDCVFPTRLARNGTLFTQDGRMVLKNERYRMDTRPVMEEGPTLEYSRAYLRHLFKAGEILASVLASLHNLWFLKTLVEDARSAIQTNRFCAFKKSFLERYNAGTLA